MNFIGTYDCKMDTKGRIPIPTTLKEQLLSGGKQSFVLKRSVFQKCVEIYPAKEWEALMARMNKLNKFKKKNTDFIRKFTAGVKVVDMDTAGRLLVPKSLCEFGGIKKELVLNTAINIIEVWDKELYEQFIEDSTSDFGDLAEEVMGEIGEDV